MLGSGWVSAGHSGSKDSTHMGHAPHTCRLRPASHLPALNRRLLTTTIGRDQGRGLSGLANKRQHWDLNPGLTSSCWPVSTQGRAKDVLSRSYPDLCAGRGQAEEECPPRSTTCRTSAAALAQDPRPHTSETWRPARQPRRGLEVACSAFLGSALASHMPASQPNHVIPIPKCRQTPKHTRQRWPVSAEAA